MESGRYIATPNLLLRRKTIPILYPMNRYQSKERKRWHVDICRENNKPQELNMLSFFLRKEHQWAKQHCFTYKRLDQIDKGIKVVHTNSCDVDLTEGFMLRLLSEYISCYWVKLGRMQTASCTMGSNHLCWWYWF